MPNEQTSLTDAQAEQIGTAIGYIVVTIGNRFVVRRALVALGLPDEKAKRIYSLTAALAFIVGANLAAGKRMSDALTQKSTLS
jgi:hypothetical protein